MTFVSFPLHQSRVPMRFFVPRLSEVIITDLPKSFWCVLLFRQTGYSKSLYAQIKVWNRRKKYKKSGFRYHWWVFVQWTTGRSSCIPSRPFVSDVHPVIVFSWGLNERGCWRTVFLWGSGILSHSTRLQPSYTPYLHREGLWWCREGTVDILYRVQREDFVSSKPYRNRRTHLHHRKMNNTHVGNYSTVTDLAKLRGWSTSVPLMTAVW